MSTSFVFTVTARTSGAPVRLDGTSSDPQIRLQSLQIPKTGTDRLITKANTQDKISVTLTEFNALTTMPIPSAVTFSGDDLGTDFSVVGITVNPALAPARLQSDITSLLGSSAATGTEDR